MTISFVTPARNEEACIGATLRSILAQPSHLVKEIIVVDNASTDQTARVAAAVDPRVRVIHEPVPGVARAKAAGFAAASGDVVACIDADTTIPSYWASRVVQAFARQPQLAAVSGPYIFDLDPVGKLLNSLFQIVGFVPIHSLVNWLGFMAVANGGNLAIRREALADLGDYAEVVKFHGEDAYLIRQVRKFGPVRFSPRFSVQSSDRRIRAAGRLQTVSNNMLSWLSVTLLNRPPKIT